MEFLENGPEQDTRSSAGTSREGTTARAEVPQRAASSTCTPSFPPFLTNRSHKLNVSLSSSLGDIVFELPETLKLLLGSKFTLLFLFPLFLLFWCYPPAVHTSLLIPLSKACDAIQLRNRWRTGKKNVFSFCFTDLIHSQDSSQENKIYIKCDLSYNLVLSFFIKMDCVNTRAE